LYDPEGMEPIKADEIPADLDDSSDAEIKATPVGGSSGHAGPSVPPLSEEPSAAPLTPRRGDSDYIPGLPQQIPRHLNRSTPVNAPAPQSPLPEDDIPMAEPL
jgi:penicillin-binding protein 2